MPNTREKLIELIASKVCDTYSEACEEWLPHDCGKCYANSCHIAEIADHLIANGVVVSKMETATIATDNRGMNMQDYFIPKMHITDDVVVTNADRIRAMSDEELGKFLECFGLCHYCTEHHRLGDLRIYADEKCDEKCVEHCLEWLKQPAEP